MEANAGVPRQELEDVAREYRRVREEHHRAPAESRVRRRLGKKLDRLAERFEQVLDRTGVGELERRRWHDYLWHGAPEPAGPGEVVQLAFLGRSAAGSELRLLARPDGALDAVVDGSQAARLEAAEELARTTPGMVFDFDGIGFAERFLSRPEARAALRASIETGQPPPAALAEELLADGLVDQNGGVTERGRRALRLDVEPASRRQDVTVPLRIITRGPVDARAREKLESLLARVTELAPRPPLHLRGELAHQEDPALERPVIAKVSVDMGTRVVRAHVAAPTGVEAVDLVETRLRSRLRELADREQAARHEGRVAEEGEWRHADLAVPRPAYYPRPVEERQLVSRKTYAAEPMAAEEAAWEMRLLDHDFHLFPDISSGEDAVVYQGSDETLRLKRISGNGGYVEPFVLDPDPAPTLSVEAAVERLDVGAESFVFFVDETSGRGSLLYRRYDGHYGLVTAA